MFVFPYALYWLAWTPTWALSLVKLARIRSAAAAISAGENSDCTVSTANNTAKTAHQDKRYAMSDARPPKRPQLQLLSCKAKCARLTNAGPAAESSLGISS